MSDFKPSKRIYQKYSLDDYIKNPQAVKEANDAAFDYFETLVRENKKLRQEVRARQRDLLFAKEGTRVRWTAQLLQVILTLIAIVLVGYGFTLASLSPQDPSGWVLVGFGIVIELISLFILLITRSQYGEH